RPPATPSTGASGCLSSPTSLQEAPGRRHTGLGAICFLRRTVAMTSRCTLIAEALGHRNAAAAAREIVNRYRTLRDLFDAAPEELTQIPGIGAKRARQLQAIFRLSQAWLNERPVESPVINNPAHAANIL